MPRKKNVTVVIHDTTPDRVFRPKVEEHGTGLDLSNRPEGFAYGETASPFPAELLIPRSEWQARIQEMEETESSLTHICDRAGLPRKNQKQTNFCWYNAPTHCLEIIRCRQHQPMVQLSAGAGASRVTRGRNVGGWGKDALDDLIANGTVPETDWANDKVSRSGWTAALTEKAKKFRVTEWWELQPRNLDQLISCLLLRIPVAVGYSWWGHEVTGAKPAWIDAAIALVIDNSWGMDWSDKGRGIIQGNRILPDDAVAPRVAIAA